MSLVPLELVMLCKAKNIVLSVVELIISSHFYYYYHILKSCVLLRLRYPLINNIFYCWSPISHASALQSDNIVHLQEVYSSKTWLMLINLALTMWNSVPQHNQLIFSIMRSVWQLSLYFHNFKIKIVSYECHTIFAFMWLIPYLQFLRILHICSSNSFFLKCCMWYSPISNPD
jgi:hypothetical protein